jgi:hypothetical protein
MKADKPAMPPPRSDQSCGAPELIPAKLPWMPTGKQPVTISEVRREIDSALDEIDTLPPIEKLDAPKPIKGILYGGKLFPRSERASLYRLTLIVVLLISLAFIGGTAFSLYLGIVPGFLR